MKKLFLVSSLLFLSISAIAETNLRCEFYKICNAESCTSLENYKEIVNISYQYGIFSQDTVTINENEAIYNADFGDKKIIFSSQKDNILFRHVINKQFLSYKRTQIDLNNKSQFGEAYRLIQEEEFICTKLN